MGWNAGYTIFEATVIGVYNAGKLDREMLGLLMEPYRGTDIDAGGSEDLKSNDGKEVMQIVIEVWGGTMPEKPQVDEDDDEDFLWDDYRDGVCMEFGKATKHFGWG